VSWIWNNVIFNNGIRLNFALNSAIMLWKRTVNWWKCSVMKPWVVLRCFDGIQFLKMVMKASGINQRPKIIEGKSKVKTMMICFFDIKEIVHKESIPPGQTVNQHFYLKVLDRCESLESVQRLPKRGSFIMAMLYAIVPSVCRDLWPLRTS